MTTKILELNNLDRKLFWIFSGLIVVLAAYYLYAMLSITSAGVARKHVVEVAYRVSLEAGELEREYMNMQNGVTLARANELGLREVAATFAGKEERGTSANTGIKVSFARP